MTRYLLGILIGALLAAAVLAAAAYALLQQHPFPTGFLPHHLASATSHWRALPPAAIGCLLGGWALAGIVGGFSAAAIAGPRRAAAALTVGTLLAMAAMAYTVLVPGLPWVSVLGMLLPLPFALAGLLLAPWKGPAYPRPAFDPA